MSVAYSGMLRQKPTTAPLAPWSAATYGGSFAPSSAASRRPEMTRSSSGAVIGIGARGFHGPRTGLASDLVAPVIGPFWYKNAIFYSLDCETFYDANGDGTGDFEGLIERLDYVASLGATCLWLQPFYPSPDRDGGYDITDYLNVDPLLGDLGKFVCFMEKANTLGLRVVVDLVVNHTSREHAWFRAARSDRKSVYRDFYVWADEPAPFTDEQVSLKGEEDRIWSFDEAAGQYYLHKFYREQPDLNIANPRVRAEILRIMGFWLRLGVAGFRVDAAEFLVESYPHHLDLSPFIREMRRFVAQRSPDAVLLAETNLPPSKMRTFVDQGKMQMGFGFFLNQHLFLALARGEVAPLRAAVAELPVLADECQMLNFLRHHDELSLKLLKDDERSDVLKAFAKDPAARIFDEMGIRRRLPSLLNDDPEQLRLAYSLCFSLPGTPLLRYGDDIGMGDDLRLHGRDSVRTPMQWSRSSNGGFSTNDAHLVKHPVIREGPYRYSEVNVGDAQRDPDSLLSFMERLIAMRRRCPQIGLGTVRTLPARNEAVFAHAISHGDDVLVFVHNLGKREAVVRPRDMGLEGATLIPLFGSAGETLEAHGYRWARIDNGK